MARYLFVLSPCLPTQNAADVARYLWTVVELCIPYIACPFLTPGVCRV